MGLNNLVVQGAMKREAKKLAEWASKTYPVVKAQNPNLDDREIHKLMMFENLSAAPERMIKKVNICSQSIQGLCYMGAMDMGALKGFMVFRCLQFTQYMDSELKTRGFKAQSRETKKQILEAMDLLVDGWEKYL